MTVDFPVSVDLILSCLPVLVQSVSFVTKSFICEEFHDYCPQLFLFTVTQSSF